MRFFYLDPGLHSHVGHHANTCRVITTELRRRGIETTVAGSVFLTPELQSELGARPFFNFYTYHVTAGDPIADWLSVFQRGVGATVKDLSRLPAMTPDDVVFLNTAQPTQFMSLVTWLNRLPAPERPRAVIEFGLDAGLEVKQTEGMLTFEPARDDPRGILYRYVGLSIPPSIRPHLFLKTFDPFASQGYAFITGLETGVLPLPQQAHAPLRKKAGKRPIVIGILGDQRPDKGYKKVPAIMTALLARHEHIRFLVHNAAPTGMPGTQDLVREIAKADARVTVDERPADGALWQSLLSDTDLMLCPYNPTRYVASYSAVAVEALANGIPMVGPANTTLSRFAADNSGAMATFGPYEAAAIIGATQHAIQNFDALAEAAFDAAAAWNLHDRKAMLLDCILGKL